eukprot:768081-Hanusia_phi.AAC.2
MIVFGGKDANDNFLNDVWTMCIANCPPVPFFYSLKNARGEIVFMDSCPDGRCRWEEKLISQNLSEWSLFVDNQRATNLMGVVPSRPAGRVGHSAALASVTLSTGAVVDVMTVYGGMSPNCSDFCSDLWQYDILNNRWYLIYGEWIDKDLQTQQLYDYSAFNELHPSKRFGHAIAVVGGDMYMLGGYTQGDEYVCCGLTISLCTSLESTRTEWYQIADPKCPFLNDVWMTHLTGYEPFFSQLALGKQTTQSSTLSGGLSWYAVDGVKNGSASSGSASLTNTDSQAWWQVDLGSVHMVSTLGYPPPTLLPTFPIPSLFFAFTLPSANDRSLANTAWCFLGLSPFVSDRLQVVAFPYLQYMSLFFIFYAPSSYRQALLMYSYVIRQDILHDPNVQKAHVMYLESNSIAIDVDSKVQYIRVQLAGTDYLSLAEVEVWGYPEIQVRNAVCLHGGAGERASTMRRGLQKWSVEEQR